MISGDDLFALERELDRLGSEKPESIDLLCAALRQIYDTPSYQEWLNSNSPVIRRYELEPDFGTDLNFSTRRFLDSTGLVNGSILDVKIDQHMGRIHITDGPWVPASFRVYPYSDESALICAHVKEMGYHLEADVLIDPACGCGHHGLALSEIPVRAYYDVNPRAAVFCRINTILAKAETMQSGLNDLREGMPALLRKLCADYVLVTVNMPFAIFPKSGGLPTTLAQDGGAQGVALTFAAMKAVKKWAGESPHVKRIRLVLLFYSLGNDEGWEVVDRARQIFGEALTFRIFEDEQMWRVNGAKAERNPMPLSRLATKAHCSHTYFRADQERAERGYRELEAHFRAAGYDRLGYGLLDVQVKG